MYIKRISPKMKGSITKNNLLKLDRCWTAGVLQCLLLFSHWDVFLMKAKKKKLEL